MSDLQLESPTELGSTPQNQKHTLPALKTLLPLGLYNKIDRSAWYGFDQIFRHLGFPRLSRYLEWENSVDRNLRSLNQLSLENVLRGSNIPRINHVKASCLKGTSIPSCNCQGTSSCNSRNVAISNTNSFAFSFRARHQ